MGTQESPDLVSRLLFGAVRRDVLALLFGRPDERFYLREILRAAGGGSGAVQRELKGLVEAGLVRRESVGQLVYFSANQDAAIFPELRAIVEKTAGAVDVLRGALAPFLGLGRRIDLALIYGSVAAGRKTARSDIDLLIVGRVLLSEIIPALRAAESRLGREINPTLYPMDEFKAKIHAGAPFLKRVLASPLLYVVGDAHDVERLAR